ncbi:MAG: hypothetical protein KDJ67_02335 [Nitratireductor sp.]|nr:hypothetical protein [Nitratireductor sp.]MCB1448952.1 hypothetical protein [Nitratireductor sp.]
MNWLKTLLQILVLVFAPIILIVVGAGIAVAGIQFSWLWLVWTGVAVAGIGVIWILAYFSDFDLF